jgi:hypothetical protein
MSKDAHFEFLEALALAGMMGASARDSKHVPEANGHADGWSGPGGAN